jgi:DNA polymerase-3 subunit epsilon
VQLQLSLTLADELYDLLLLTGEPVDFLDAAHRLLALKAAPEGLCRQVMDTLVSEDRRFCWSSPTTVGLADWRLADPDLADVAFVVIDLETTGTRAGLSKITEIGAVRIEGLREVGMFETLVNPLRAIPPKVVEITGITPSMLIGAPRIEEVMPHLLDFIDGAVIVAHNAPFDLGFLNYELGRLRGRRLGEGAIDTVSLARCAAPGLPNYRLGTVADALGSRVAAAHRALADAQATSHVFLTCVGRLQERNITRLHELRSFVDPGHKRDRHKLALTRDIPRVPGTYLFRDADGNILYVGKADRLRDRVSSYFLASANHSRKVRQAVRRLQQVDYEVTGTPLRAVVREQELILEHRPPCNVRGRRPENYCYVKLGGRGSGLRLYASDRPGRLQAGGVTSEGLIGPFRGRTRVLRAIDLLQKTYPVRQCRGVRGQGPCIYGQTRSCLSPCSPDRATLQEHDDLVRELLLWLTGGPAPAMGDPFERGRALRARLSAQQRYEDAQEVQDGIEGLAALRRSYRALTEALEVRTAVIWPLPSGNGARAAQFELIWRGSLRASARLEATTAPAEIGRLLRTLPTPEEEERDKTPRGVLAVRQEELDLLLAVRQWVQEAPPASVVHFPDEGDHERSLEHWRRRLVDAALRSLEA